ncbi:hypothetical protein ON010_g6394 [Phytophthora cinnamomi]|nr:hypothetical protein ON010_g6394 [Phytophthora cinnamomi]
MIVKPSVVVSTEVAVAAIVAERVNRALHRRDVPASVGAICWCPLGTPSAPAHHRATYLLDFVLLSVGDAVSHVVHQLFSGETLARDDLERRDFELLLWIRRQRVLVCAERHGYLDSESLRVIQREPDALKHPESKVGHVTQLRNILLPLLRFFADGASDRAFLAAIAKYVQQRVKMRLACDVEARAHRPMR